MCSHRDLRVLDHDFQFYFRLQRSHPAGYRHRMWRKGNTQPKLNIKHTSCIALVWFSRWRCKVQLALTSEITTWLRGFFVLRYYIADKNLIKMGNYSVGLPEEEDCHFLPLKHVYGMMAVNILSTVIGTIGNVLVIGTVRTNYALQIISNFWLVSMAVADLFVTALGQPLFSVFLGLQIGGQCNIFVSQAFRLIANMSCSASVLHLCLISIDRCLVILRPHDFREIRTKNRFKIALVIAWTLPIVYGILRLTVSKTATSYFTVIAVGLCYVAIIVCYSLIILKVRKQGSATLKRFRSQSGRGVASEHVVERRVTVTIAIVVVIFTICWFPLLYLRSAFAEENFGVAYNWARTLALTNSSMNPWIYCFRIAEFRQAYRRLIRCQWKPVCTCNGGTGEQREMTTGTHSSDLETSHQGPNAV